MTDTLFPWTGNKQKLLPFILPMVPPSATTSVEAFGGSAAYSLGLKPKKGRLDIYNDLNNDLFNLFCCLKEKPIALAKELDFFPVHGRIPFQFYRNILNHESDYLKNIDLEKEIIQSERSFTEEEVRELLKILDGRANLFDVQRAVAFLMITHGSYNGTCKSVGIRTVDVGAIIKRMPKVSDRMHSLVLENKDAMELISERDGGDTVIYADPPYFKTERCYSVQFLPRDHIELRDVLRDCNGYVILSYNNCKEAWYLYEEDFFIFGLTRNNPMAKKRGAVYKEVIITNYDPRPLMDHQMDLFEQTTKEKWELIPLNIPKHIKKTL